MLKITTKNEGETTKLELEGKLAGAWVDELERCWMDVHPHGNVTISLTAVTFIDDTGKKLLARLHQGGAALEAAGCMTKCIVEDIVAEIESRRKT
jgi:anti-anti-sigma regulatory factor